MEEKKKAASSTTHSLNLHDKGNGSQAQYQIVYQSFKEHPKTMFQVEKETGVVRPNICRFVAMMEDASIIQLHYKADCPISGCRAGYYTTDEKLFITSPQQLSLFKEGGSNE